MSKKSLSSNTSVLVQIRSYLNADQSLVCRYIFFNDIKGFAFKNNITDLQSYLGSWGLQLTSPRHGGLRGRLTTMQHFGACFCPQNICYLSNQIKNLQLYWKCSGGYTNSFPFFILIFRTEWEAVHQRSLQQTVCCGNNL